MLSNGSSCPRCGSQNIIPSVQVIGRGNENEEKLIARIYTKPQARLLKGARDHTLIAQVCGECGHVELVAKRAKELYMLYQQIEQGTFISSPLTRDTQDSSSNKFFFILMLMMAVMMAVMILVAVVVLLMLLQPL